MIHPRLLLAAALAAPAFAAAAPQAVTWTPAQLAASGIQVQRIAPGAYAPAVAGYAAVENPASLLRLHSAVDAAAARLAAARARLQMMELRSRQARGLFAAGQNVARAEVDQAEAAAVEARAAAGAARSELDAARAAESAALGPALSTRLARDPGLVGAIAAGRRMVVAVTLPPGTPWPADARVDLLLPSGATAALAVVGPAAGADARMQGLRYLGLATAAPGLMPGLHLAARVEVPRPVRGVRVPAAAVVWSGGRAWVFVASPADAAGRSFAPRPVSTDWPLSGGYVQRGWPTVDVAVRGAGLLLTPPPLPQPAGAGPAAQGDGDD